MRKFNKKVTAAIAGTALALVASGVAYAYWTTTGSGTGAATTKTNTDTLTLHAAFDDNITPGGTKAVTFTADNPGTSSLYVTTIHLASVSVDTAHSTCAVADYTMPNVASNTRVLAGATAAALAGVGTLTLADTAANQDACQGAEITLHVTSS